MRRPDRPLPAAPARHRLLVAAVLCALTLSGCHRSSTIAETPARPQPASPTEPLAQAAPATTSEAEAGNAEAKRTLPGRREQARANLGAIGTTDAYSAQMAPAPAPPPPPPSSIPVSRPHPMVAVEASRMRDAQGLVAAPMPEVANTERYAERDDNPVRRVAEEPVSTFSIDVDTGSYSNVRRMLNQGARPPADAVRAEEMINYFDYGHPGPSSLSTPFRVTTELAPAPWNAKRQLLMIGIKGYDVPKAELPPANLVFLIDTSGSMQSADKLPLLKQSFAQLVEQLRPQDRVTIVVYAGSAGLVLEPTPGSEKETILAALGKLEAGGSTNGGAGIQLAYAMAKQAYVKDGVNRVILATDGDFNVGTTDPKALETLVADQRSHGIALTTLGFGQGNYNDDMAERLADVGDGNHAYIDTLLEARKVLVQEMQSTLLTIARDVKIQIEFNPAQVAEYRLIGYENRMLRREDFANDRVDAGDIGAGHEVTALYEVVLVGSDGARLPALRYGNAPKTAPPATAGELAHLRLRYKRPGEDVSRLIERPLSSASLRRRAPSVQFRFAATVAAYADALRGGNNIDGWTWEDIARSARDTRGADPWKERAEFVDLVDAARRLTAGDAPQVGMIAD
jgi:Ca-activated chloride channel family protein